MPDESVIPAAVLAQRIADVRRRMAAAVQAAGRPSGQVTALLATKTQTPATIRAAVEALAAGADHPAGAPVLIGENRVQELTAKAGDLHDLTAAARISTHLIGPLQRNKINAVLASPAACIQSVDSLPLAQAISSRCLRAGRTMNVMVQVNVSDEASKSGVAPHDALALALAVALLPGLRLTGLMTIGAHTSDQAVIRRGYACLREIRDAVQASGAPGTEAAHHLSMGMSSDLELAIAEGASMVRIGSAIFGSRPTTH
ncbi:MAG: YggS family pyridoxal phosphate-dependent enzyme [Cellulomonadaceae bacterium]|nr:YggS family pyridoxal phosphate-dependent enzyme [Cellulomonadaceae bacterium]